MEVKDILNDEVSHDEAKEAIKERVRNVVDEMAVEEKPKDYKEEEGDEDEEEDDEEEGDESEEDDDECGMEESLSENKQVTAHTPSGRSTEFEISRLRELKKYAQTGKYDYFVVKDRDGSETDYSVDPSGNLTEM